MDHSTRRKLLQTGLAAALLAAGGMPVSAQARSGGRLRIGLSAGSGSGFWSPLEGLGPFQTVAGSGLVFDTLTEIGPDGLLRGELAVSWEPARKGRVWTVNLDPDARFHDGQPFTAEDAIASFDLHLARGTSGHGLRQTIASIRAVSAHQLVFTLTVPNPNFPKLLSDPALIMVPASDPTRALAEGIGTGLYRVSAFDPRTRLLAERVIGHHRPDRGGWFSSVELLALPDQEDRVSALRQGRVDVIDSAPESLMRHARNLEVLTIPQAEFIQFSPGAACPSGQHRHLMHGLRLGLDRQALAEAVQGHALPLHGAHLPASEAADSRAALEVFSSRPLTLSVAPGAGAAGLKLVAHAMRQLSALGVTTELVPSTASSMLHARQGYTRATSAWTALALQNGLHRMPDASVPGAPTAVSLETDTSCVPVLLDGCLAVSNAVARPATSGDGWATGHARLAERWWRA